MTRAPAKTLTHAVVGAGASVFNMHQPAWELPTCQIVALCDTQAEAAATRADALAVPYFQNYRDMLAAVQPDIVVIMTPHPFHAEQAVAAFQAGCHVLVEKPMAVQVAEADEMIEAATAADRLLAINFQQRFRPEIRAAHALLAAGRLGRIQHIELSLSWTRSATYYASGDWRATWRGEGGGLLLNQAPHDLDLICHLFGVPDAVFAWARTTLHAIETEDTVQAALRWPSGAMGSIHISTAQGPRPYRLQVVGSQGVLTIDKGNLTLTQYDQDIATFITESPDSFGAPTSAAAAVTLPQGQGDHTAVYRDLHRAILDGDPLLCTGLSGRPSLELANAMIQSSAEQREVTLPLDRSRYASLLAQLQASA